AHHRDLPGLPALRSSDLPDRHARPGGSTSGAARLLVAAGSLRDDDGADDLVGEGLALGVPQREQPADVARERVEDVADVAGEGHAAAHRLAGSLADKAQVERPLPQRLTGPPGLDAPVVDPPPERRDDGQ